MQVNPLFSIDSKVNRQTQKLAFDEKADFNVWRESVREKFLELIGYDIISACACEPKLDIEEIEQKEGYRQIRFSFMSEQDVVVPCYLLIPDSVKEKAPVAIVLQGHSTGFHRSIGVIKYRPEDENHERAHHALQAIEQGYIALAIEQRGMGESSAQNQENRRVHLGVRGGCYYSQMTNLLLGRTLIGERCWDVSRAIDQLSNFPECDTDKIMIIGGSGGGTISYYAACVDERIKVSVPVVAFCTFSQSILKFYHCSCNYIPSMYRYLDMPDVSCLIAPRKLIIINGKDDPSFLIDGAKEGYKTVEKIYKKMNAEENCKFIETPFGHYWANDLIWSEVQPEVKKLGWFKD
jgi:cephalosporin-C deacetylase-like acetyl esterase